MQLSVLSCIRIDVVHNIKNNYLENRVSMELSKIGDVRSRNDKDTIDRRRQKILLMLFLSTSGLISASQNNTYLRKLLDDFITNC